MPSGTVDDAQNIPRIVPVSLIGSTQGILGVVENGRSIGFDVKRFYFLADVPKGGERGGHAHKGLWQFIICLKGSVTVEAKSGTQTHTFMLGSYSEGLILPPGYWRELRDFAAHTIVAVAASMPFDEADYIRSFDDFLRWRSSLKKPDRVSYLPIERNIDEAFVGGHAADLRKAISATVDSGWYIGGPEVERFEKSFATYCGTSAAVGLANGFEALQLALQAENIGPGDEVIVPSHTFVATALAVTQVGATPVLVDVEDDTGLIDVARIADAVTSRTRAIVPVHLYGHPVDMDALLAIARKSELLIIEDAAQAHGARYKGRACGSLGDVAGFSFYPTKNLGAMGDGGAVTSNDTGRVERIRKIANYGSSERHRHDLKGINSRLDPIQAAVLASKLSHLDAWNARRRDLAARYFSGLAGINGLRLSAVRPWATPVWHVFPVRVVDGRRDALQLFLTAKKIGTNIHYPFAMHQHACFADMNWRAEDFPVATGLAREVLSLPLSQHHSDAEIDFVIENVRQFFAQC